MQQKIINRLSDNLTRQKQLYLDMLELSQKEAEYLAEGNIDGLSKVLAVIETITKTIGEVEADRQDMIMQFSDASGMDKDIRLSDIIKSHPEEADKLRLIQNELVGLMKEISNTENKNAKLIKKALADIDYMKNLFTEDDSGIYTKKGKNGNNNFLLNEKI